MTFISTVFNHYFLENPRNVIVQNPPISPLLESQMAGNMPMIEYPLPIPPVNKNNIDPFPRTIISEIPPISLPPNSPRPVPKTHNRINPTKLQKLESEYNKIDSMSNAELIKCKISNDLVQKQLESENQRITKESAELYKNIKKYQDQNDM